MAHMQSIPSVEVGSAATVVGWEGGMDEGGRLLDIGGGGSGGGRGFDFRLGGVVIGIAGIGGGGGEMGVGGGIDPRK